MKKRFLSILLALVMVIGMLPTTAFAASACPHTNVDWHKSSSGDEEHFKICTNPDCDDHKGSIVERGLHTDTNADGNCDDCSVELIHVTFDYEDPAKTDKVVLFAKGAVARDYNAYIADWDEKDGYVANKWELSLEKTPAASLSQDGIGQTIMVGDAVYTTHWHKLYEEIHFSFTGYEIGANISDGVLTDDIDGYASLDFPELWGGKNFVIVADKDGIPDMTDPSTMLKVVTGAFEGNKDYWLAVLIGGEGRHITGDIAVEAYGIDDYFLDSPDCVGKHWYGYGEAEIAFFKLKPLNASGFTFPWWGLGILSGTGCICDPYTDVDKSAWYHEAVDYALETGLMAGLNETTFAPNGTMTRAMVWTVLGRLSGQEFDGTGANWYVEAQNWAIANGISDGTNPNGAITREELVTMLWRFVGQPAASENPLHWYNDGATVSDWAVDAMAWAVNSQIVEGSNYSLNPQGTALRAQVAAILMRYFG